MSTGLSRALAALAFVWIALAAQVATAAEQPVKPVGADPQLFPPAQSCACHGDLVQQWSKSMHAQALTDPIYQAKLAQAQEATDGKIGEFCDTCHGPAATMTGEMAAGGTMSPGAADAVGCSFCHQITGIGDEVANTSQLVTLDGVRRAQLKDPQAPHPAAFSEFHSKAELCGGCHNVNHPVNGMHLEATYSEWKASPYAAEGVTCQDCHMSEGAGVIGPSSGQAAMGGPQRDNIYRMSFVGANVELSDSAAAEAMLKSAATVDVDVPEIVPAGEEASASVTVTNVGAGHYLPTGLTEVREMWLEVVFEDATGTKTALAERRFGTILQDDEGNAPVELWEATSIKSDDRIPPKKSVSEPFSVALPGGAEKGTVTAALYYRSVGDDLAQKAGVKNPVTTMAQASTQVFASEAARDAAAQEPAKDMEAPGGLDWRVIAAAVLLVVGAAAGFVYARSRKAA